MFEIPLADVEVARVGRWRPRGFDAGHLRSMVRTFNRGPVLVKVGHAQGDDAVIVGRVRGVRFRDGRLFADMRISRDAAARVQSGELHGCSIEEIDDGPDRRLIAVALVDQTDTPAIPGMCPPAACLPRSFSMERMTAHSLHCYSLSVGPDGRLDGGEDKVRSYSVDSTAGLLAIKGAVKSPDPVEPWNNNARPASTMTGREAEARLHEMAVQYAHDNFVGYESALSFVLTDPRNERLVACYHLGIQPGDKLKVVEAPTRVIDDRARAAASVVIDKAARGFMRQDKGLGYAAAVAKALAADPATARTWTGVS